MTNVVIRTFSAKRGAQAVVRYCLNSLASATMRQVAATAISIFGVENDPRRLVWVGDRGQEEDFARLSPFSGASLAWLHPYLAASPPARTLRLVKEHHRQVPTPYQLWSVEVTSDARGINLRHDLDAVQADARLIGSALYTAIYDPAVFILFLGLAGGVTPSGLGFNVTRRLGRAVVCGRLSLILDFRRLTVGAPCAFPQWMREGMPNRPDRAYPVAASRGPRLFPRPSPA